MKKTLNVGIGGYSFIIDEDAYRKLDQYLSRFRSEMDHKEAQEVMDDVEQRIAELFKQYTGANGEVVTVWIVERVIDQLGYPNGQTYYDQESHGGESFRPVNEPQPTPVKRFFRNTQEKVFGGVCSGLAAYFNVDVVLWRVIAVAALLCGSVGFWVYLILWVAVPAAKTAADQCQMRGLPITAQNLRKFGSYR